MTLKCIDSGYIIEELACTTVYVHGPIQDPWTLKETPIYCYEDHKCWHEDMNLTLRQIIYLYSPSVLIWTDRWIGQNNWTAYMRPS